MIKSYNKILKDTDVYEYLFSNGDELSILAYSIYRNSIKIYSDEPICKIEYFILNENNMFSKYFLQAQKILRIEKLKNIL